MKRTGIIAVIAVAALVIFNLLMSSGLTGMRWDLTENKLYTLSEGSKSILQNLDKDIELNLYFSDQSSKDLPALRAYAKRVQELLQEFEQLAGGKITLNVIDPAPFSEDEDNATVAGLQSIPVGVSGENVFFGLVGKVKSDEVGDAKDAETEEDLAAVVAAEEVIAFFQPDKEQFLEYDLSKLIYSLNRQKSPVVGILSGLEINGGMDFYGQGQRPAWVFMQYLEDLFDVQWVSNDADKIDDSIDVLLLIHPKDLSDQALLAIDQFALKGGRILAFVDPFAEQDQPSMPMMAANQSRNSDLGPLLKAWGLQLREGAVLADFDNSMVVGVGPQRTPTRHLALLGLTKDNWDGEDVVLSGLESINVSTSGILDMVEGHTTKITPLISSSTESSALEASLFATLDNPEKLFDGFTPSGERYTIAARVEGKATTAYPDGIEIEEPVEPAEGDDTGASSAGDEATNNSEATADEADAEPKTVTRKVMADISETDNLNVLVFADTDILSDRLWVQVQEFFGQRIASPWANNGDLLVNALDNLSGNADLINIRSRGRFTRPFTVVEELRRKAEEKFADQQRELETRLEETESKLAELQSARAGADANSAILSPEQEQALLSFQEEKLKIRKALRDVQHSLDQNIEDLGRQLKLINIVLVPLALTVIALLVALWRRSKRMV
ncbi:ABC transporter [Hahella sp. CCB-MM4]|uniref:GldG family protein n=1 Tax=Hahella sp. (strain CCB-MM4) TaxID=1926491 RepID=UPI000B9A3A47|nr:Gldg family protein [Hahella sp. CCB-MM4]OZG72530.1 ABC transporter [Hahella sp. CCB-MM4]